MNNTYANVKRFLKTFVHQTIDYSHGAFQVFVDTLKCHPDYESWKYKEPLSFKITRSPRKKALQVWVLFNGCKRYRMVSWIACCSDRTRPKVDILTQCMRTSIQDQLVDYREQQPIQKCAICEQWSSSSLEVDHYPVMFKTLKKQFLSQFPKSELPTASRWNGRRHVFFKKDEKFEMLWCKYHLQNASYRLLCSKCNQKFK